MISTPSQHVQKTITSTAHESLHLPSFGATPRVPLEGLPARTTTSDSLPYKTSTLPGKSATHIGNQFSILTDKTPPTKISCSKGVIRDITIGFPKNLAIYTFRGARAGLSCGVQTTQSAIGEGWRVNATGAALGVVPGILGAMAGFMYGAAHSAKNIKDSATGRYINIDDTLNIETKSMDLLKLILNSIPLDRIKTNEQGQTIVHLERSDLAPNSTARTMSRAQEDINIQDTLQAIKRRIQSSEGIPPIEKLLIEGAAININQIPGESPPALYNYKVRGPHSTIQIPNSLSKEQAGTAGLQFTKNLDLFAKSEEWDGATQMRLAFG